MNRAIRQLEAQPALSFEAVGGGQAEVGDAVAGGVSPDVQLTHVAVQGQVQPGRGDGAGEDHGVTAGPIGATHEGSDRVGIAIVESGEVEGGGCRDDDALGSHLAAAWRSGGGFLCQGRRHGPIDAFGHRQHCLIEPDVAPGIQASEGTDSVAELDEDGVGLRGHGDFAAIVAPCRSQRIFEPFLDGKVLLAEAEVHLSHLQRLVATPELEAQIHQPDAACLDGEPERPGVGRHRYLLGHELGA